VAVRSKVHRTLYAPTLRTLLTMLTCRATCDGFVLIVKGQPAKKLFSATVQAVRVLDTVCVSCYLPAPLTHTDVHRKRVENVRRVHGVVIGIRANNLKCFPITTSPSQTNFYDSAKHICHS
jgi:hypothetical protein